MDSSFNKISLLVYFLAFFFPVLRNADYIGFQVFLCVLLYINDPILFLCWSANIVFGIALIAPAGSWKKFFLSFASLAFGSVLITYGHIPGSDIMGNNPEPAFYGTGYILWISAFAITFVGSIIDLRAANKNAVRGSHGIV